MNLTFKNETPSINTHVKFITKLSLKIKKNSPIAVNLSVVPIIGSLVGNLCILMLLLVLVLESCHLVSSVEKVVQRTSGVICGGAVAMVGRHKVSPTVDQRLPKVQHSVRLRFALDWLLIVRGVIQFAR